MKPGVITTETDGQRYADVRVDGNCVASIDVKDDTLEIKVIDPNRPEDAVETSKFEIKRGENPE